MVLNDLKIKRGYIMDSDCKVCGYSEGLHHYKTKQCPKGGEALPGKKQEWLESVFTFNEDDYKTIVINCKNKTDEEILKEIRAYNDKGFFVKLKGV